MVTEPEPTSSVPETPVEQPAQEPEPTVPETPVEPSPETTQADIEAVRQELKAAQERAEALEHARRQAQSDADKKVAQALARERQRTTYHQLKQVRAAKDTDPQAAEEWDRAMQTPEYVRAWQAGLQAEQADGEPVNAAEQLAELLADDSLEALRVTPTAVKHALARAQAETVGTFQAQLLSHVKGKGITEGQFNDMEKAAFEAKKPWTGFLADVVDALVEKRLETERPETEKAVAAATREEERRKAGDVAEIKGGGPGQEPDVASAVGQEAKKAAFKKKYGFDALT